MQNYGFTLTIDGHQECSLDMADAIFEAGCDDSSVGSREGKVLVDFDRQSSSLDEAIRSAVADLAKAGYQVSHVDIADDTLRLLSA